MNATDEPVPALRPLEVVPVTENGRDFIILRDPAGYSDKVLAFAPEIIPVLAMFDGQRTIEDIAHEIEQAVGEPIPFENLGSLVELMEKARFLQSDSFIQECTRIDSEFVKQPVRNAILSGNGYPSDPAALADRLNHYLDSPPPDDFEPEIPTSGQLKALLVPHIDFNRGGPTYGRGYHELANRLPDLGDKPLLIGILGVAHFGSLAPVIFAEKDFITPLGKLDYNRQAYETIREELGDQFFMEQWKHRNEHSIELQVIWLQHLLKDRDLTFIPVLVGPFSEGDSGTPGDNDEVEKIVNTLHTVEERHDGPVLWISSVDLSHVGPRFDDQTPVDAAFAAKVAQKDMKALKTLREADPEAWWECIMKDENKYRICGLYSTYLLLRLLEHTSGYILDYQQAISPQLDQMVSFAAASFHKIETE